MKRFVLGLLAIAGASLTIFFVLRSESALLAHPKGIIARSQLELIVTNLLLMLLVVIPTFIALFAVVWKYRAKNNPEKSKGIFRELILWIIPMPFIAVMTIVTWNATHELDPYQPIESDVKPLLIQVVAIDWKWLFIYPEQGIATVNFVQFPATYPDSFQSRGRWLSDELVLDSTTERTNLLHDRNDQPSFTSWPMGRGSIPEEPRRSMAEDLRI